MFKTIVLMIILIMGVFAKDIDRLEVGSKEYNKLREKLIEIQNSKFEKDEIEYIVNNILVFSNDFKRKRYQIKYAKRVAKFPRKIQLKLLQRYQDTVIHINPKKYLMKNNQKS